MKFEVNGRTIPTDEKYKTTINGKTVYLTEVSANGKTVWEYKSSGGGNPGGGGHWEPNRTFFSPSDISNGSNVRCTPNTHGTFTCTRYVWVPDDESENSSKDTDS